jgi:hypothetical protein
MSVYFKLQNGQMEIKRDVSGDQVVELVCNTDQVYSMSNRSSIIR